ncbi:unnamed protein product [Cylicocyclus nassatus]|uniref:Uncharacterized protein n=1 Tax=Cylicocyclus nassatus TaxID=53992 RepID=A0AA36H5E7_CYLNA|nr:unnamed protein product [Cylicocyclus nassatus]
MRLFSLVLALGIAVTVLATAWDNKQWCAQPCRYYRTQPDWNNYINIEKIAREDCYPIAQAKLVKGIEDFCHYVYWLRRNNMDLRAMQSYRCIPWVNKDAK